MDGRFKFQELIVDKNETVLSIRGSSKQGYLVQAFSRPALRSR